MYRIRHKGKRILFYVTEVKIEVTYLKKIHTSKIFNIKN